MGVVGSAHRSPPASLRDPCDAVASILLLGKLRPRSLAGWVGWGGGRCGWSRGPEGKGSLPSCTGSVRLVWGPQGRGGAGAVALTVCEPLPPALPRLQSIHIICSLCQLLCNVSSQTATRQKTRSCAVPTAQRPVREPRTLSCSSPAPPPTPPRVLIFWASALQPSGAQTRPALRGSPVTPASKSLSPPP